MSRRALAAALAIALAACTAGSDDARPTSTTRPTPSTSVVDLSGVALPGVAGETTSTLRETGTARLVGTVTGPSGSVEGATVRIERLVAGREVRTDVVAGPDGRFQLDGVPGGRYRVRAFLPPSLAQVAPEVRFVPDGDEAAFDLTVEAFAGVQVLADVAPDAPVVDGPVNLVVQVVERQVDGDGIVRAVGVSGVVVQLTGLGAWVPLTAPGAGPTTSSTGVSLTPSTTSTTRPPSAIEAITDGAGQVTFALRCERPGAPGLSVLVPIRTSSPDPAGGSEATIVQTVDRPFPLELPACGSAGAPPGADDDGDDGATSSTTADPG